MRILVFGAGAVGSLLGALLSRAHDVSLVARATHAHAINRNGLSVEGIQPFTARPRALLGPSPEPPEAALVTVKAYDTQQALADLRPYLGPRTTIATLQNGLGNWELAIRANPGRAVLGGSVTCGAAILGPGRVQWNGIGTVVVGGASEHRALAQQLADAFRAAHVTADVTDNLPGVLWTKAIVNASINPLSALNRLPNGALLQDPAIRAEMKRACDEAAAVARAEGIRLTAQDPWRVVEDVATKTGQNRSSMLQSVERGQPTEIEAITGRILEAARRHGLACPANQRLYESVSRLAARPA